MRPIAHMLKLKKLGFDSRQTPGRLLEALGNLKKDGDEEVEEAIIESEYSSKNENENEGFEFTNLHISLNPNANEAENRGSQASGQPQ